MKFAMIMVGRPMRPAALFSCASPQRLRFLRFFTPSGGGSAAEDVSQNQVYTNRKNELLYIPRTGLRPRAASLSSEGASVGVEALLAASSSAPNRLLPRGTLLEPVTPWLRQAMVCESSPAGRLCRRLVARRREVRK